MVGTLKFRCQHCGANLVFRQEHSGRQAKCRACGMTVRIPTSTSESPNLRATAQENMTSQPIETENHRRTGESQIQDLSLETKEFPGIHLSGFFRGRMLWNGMGTVRVSPDTIVLQARTVNTLFGVIYITFAFVVMMIGGLIAVATFLPNRELFGNFLSQEFLLVRIVVGVSLVLFVFAMVFCGKFITRQETLIIKQEEIVKTKHDPQGREGRPLIVVFLTGRDYIYFVFKKPLEQEFAALVLNVAKTSVRQS